MRKGRGIHVLALGLVAALAVTNVPVGVSAEETVSDMTNIDDKYSNEGYSLVWNDEFEGDSLNTNDWNVEQHEPGWVNSELQRYTGLDEGNIEVRDGGLHIRPHITEQQETETEDDVSAIDEDSVDISGNDVVLKNSEHVSFEVNVGDKATSETIALQVNLGKIDDSTEGMSGTVIQLSNISLKDIATGEELLKDTDFADNGNWNCGITAPATGSYSSADGIATLIVTNAGDANWNYQLQQGGIKLESGHTYELTVDATSTKDRIVEINLLDPENGYDWYGGSKVILTGTGTGNSSAGQDSELKEITSGRITTQGLHDFTYGRFEARAKVPVGKGYLPAFWLMATDEGLYGQWPKCGEIDIMEVMGQNTSKSYHTIHYGYDSGSGHKENQGNKYQRETSYSDDYHTFRVDWEPGSIKWYVDDEEVYSTNDWYTGQDDASQLTYPAPFDQNFYIILNLAVGGSWVGYPDDSVYEHMNEDEFLVDYVRVYQKSAEEYEQMEQNAKRPEAAEITYREPDENGNYVINGDFSQNIAMDGAADATSDNWKLHLESDAEGTEYTVNDNKIEIRPAAIGAQPHSIQLKQEQIPMYRGWEYELTFDAVADEDRNIVIDVEGPDRGWKRYMQDTTVPVTCEKKTYTYTFTMNDKTDANSSLEFNLGKQDSTAAVRISNVQLIHKSGDEIVDGNEKTIRPDGNYIYNGGFDQGENRLGYWNINNKEAVSVTNKQNTRMLKVVAPADTSTENPVIVSQGDLSPINAGQYEMSLEGYVEGDNTDGLTVNIAGQSYVQELGINKDKHSKKITVEQNLDRKDSAIELIFTKPGTYYIDNTFFADDALIKNGSFNAGLSGFSPYIYDSVKASYVIDNMNGNDNAFAITIDDTKADTDDNSWYVQLNQDGVNLEKGKKYRISFKAKSSIDRVIKYSLQEFEGNWTNYSGTGSVEITNEWKSFSHEFIMESETDANTRFNITMGSVDGIRITQKHDVYIDDIELIEIDGSEDKPSDESNTGSSSQEDPKPDDPNAGSSGDDPSTGDSGSAASSEASNESSNTSTEATTESGSAGEASTIDNPGENESGEGSSEQVEPQKPDNDYVVVIVIRRVVRTVVTGIARAVKAVSRFFRSIFGFF